VKVLHVNDVARIGTALVRRARDEGLAWDLYDTARVDPGWSPRMRPVRRALRGIRWEAGLVRRAVRADLLELLDAGLGRARAARFLPSFDELHVGYKDRSCLTDASGERLICPSSNGMFRPLLVDRGRLVGVRPVGEGLSLAHGHILQPGARGAGYGRLFAQT